MHDEFISHPTRPALRRACGRLAVVVAVLAALAGVPGAYDAGHDRRAHERAVGQQLVLLREAVRLYRAQHDALPGQESWPQFVAQLSAATHADGRPGGPLGPYLPAAWLEASGFAASGGRVCDALPEAPAGSEAWIWCRTSGELRANLPGEATTGAALIDL